MPATPLGRLPIRWRVALWYALLLVAVVAALGLFLATALRRDLEREVDTGLRLRALHIDGRITTGDNGLLDASDVAAGLLELEPLEEFSAPGIYVQILDRDGAVLASSPNLPDGQLPVTPAMRDAALASREVIADVPVGPERIRLLARPLHSDRRVVGVVLVGESQHLVDVTLRRVRRLLLVAAASAAAASLIGGWWLTGRALGPVRDITRVGRRIAATGQVGQRIATSAARDELGELAATLNEMLDRLERIARQQRDFLADASHELRGPLTIIRGNLDLLMLDLPAEDRRQSASEAAAEVARMGRLVDDLLFLAEVDARAVVEHLPVELHAIVHEVWERTRALDGGAHAIDLARNDAATVRGDRHWLRQLLWNLVENALRYTPAGGRVTLTLRCSRHVAELTVADTGIGIPPEHLPHLFERFYRVDPARSRQQGGTGLGLAVVKQVAEAHGGHVRVRSTPGGGTVVTVALPGSPD